MVTQLAAHPYPRHAHLHIFDDWTLDRVTRTCHNRFRIFAFIHSDDSTMNQLLYDLQRTSVRVKAKKKKRITFERVQKRDDMLSVCSRAQHVGFHAIFIYVVTVS